MVDAAFRCTDGTWHRADDVRRRSAWGMGTLTTNSGFADFVMPQGLRGASVLFVMLPANQLALGRLPTHCVKNASSLYNLMRNLGGAFGLAAIDTVATWRLAHHHLHLKEQVTWGHPVTSATIDKMPRSSPRRREAITTWPH